jgi:hypothetical protein
VHQFTPLLVAVPANTPKAAPVTVNWTVYPGWCSRFLIGIPPGHAGLTGIRLTYQTTPVIPFDLTSFLVGSGERFDVPWQDEIMQTGLAVQAYNTDKYAHNFYLWADIDPYLATYKGQLMAGGPPAVPTGAALAAVGALASAGG